MKLWTAFMAFVLAAITGLAIVAADYGTAVLAFVFLACFAAITLRSDKE